MQRVLETILVISSLGLILYGAATSGDEEVLLAFKEGMSSGDGAFKDWIPGTDFCSWTGIQCESPGASTSPRVQSISLPTRQLRGTITPLLGHLDRLQVLNLDQNNLTGAIPVTLENCTRVTNISLGSNLLSGKIPEHLDNLPNLQRLDLWNNQLEGTIPSSLGNCTRIDYLSLGQNFLRGSIPPELGKLSNLLILRIFTNNLIGPFPDFLTNCTRLQVISLRNNSLSGSIPGEVENWGALQQLRIQSNLFEGGLPPEIGNMSSLYYIDISSNRLTGSIPGSISRLSRLQELYLNNNSLSGRIPEEITGCSSLGTMDLSHNLLEGALPERIGDFMGLMNLTLDHNLISGSIPESLGRLKLINLDLSYNNLSGTLPPGLAALTNLQLAFNLAHNSLSGSIPPWIGNFRMVQSIRLQSNRFTGEIPVSLSQCVGLQSLDLSSNELTGVIPGSLASLDYLNLFNVSGNKLKGRVPGEGRFKSFNTSSFLPNPGLCGEIINRTCDEWERDGKSPRGDRDGHGHAKRIIISACVGGFCCLGVLTSAWLVYRCLCDDHQPDGDPLRGSEDNNVHSPAGPLTPFTPEGLRSMTERFAKERLIGVGGFCTVYEGKVGKESSSVAVKVLRSDMREEVRKSFLAEMKTLGQVRHRRLVRLLGYCWSQDVKALVLEYMPNGSLEKHLGAGGSPLDWRTRFNVALGVAQGMEYLHYGFDVPIIHCDLKPANILLDSEFEPRVSDFGISRIAHADDELATVSSFRGSIGYTAPEYGSVASVSTRGDVYSYGIVLLELLTGRSPTSGMFGITSSLQQWVMSASDLREVVDPRLVEHTQGDEEMEVMRGVMELALQCTSYVPKERPSMKQVLTALEKLIAAKDKSSFMPMELLVSSPSPYTVGIQW